MKTYRQRRRSEGALNRVSLAACAQMALVTLATTLATSPAHAVTVLDTFGPGASAPGEPWSLYNPLVPVADAAGQSLAVPFSLGTAATIDSVFTSIGGVGTFNLGVVAGAGLPTGAFLFSTALVDPVPNALSSGLSWALGAGDYWLVSKAADGASGLWQGGGTGGMRPWAFTFGGVDSEWFFTSPDDAPAARIDATFTGPGPVPVPVIPEPQTWALMLASLAGLGWRLRRARNTV